MFPRAPAGEPTDPGGEAGGDMLPAKGARLVLLNGEVGPVIAAGRDHWYGDWSARRADTMAAAIPLGTAG